MRRSFWTAIGVVVLAAAAGAGWILTQASEGKVVPSTVAAARGNIEETVLATGTIEASSLVNVGAEVSGRIESLNVTLGDEVKTGDVIAQIDSLNQENAVRAAEAALANMQAQRDIQSANAEQADATRARAEQLHTQKLMSDADYQTAVLAGKTSAGQLAAINAQITQAQISVETANLNLQRTKIVAPADGTVVAIAVQVGQSINANNAAPTIVKIANLDQMLVKAEISEADVPKVKPGQQVYLTILGDPKNRITATLRAIEPAPDSILNDSTSSSSSTTAIYYNGLFDVPNPDHRLRISMTAQVTIVLNAANDVVTIPASVLTRQGPDGSYGVGVWNAAADKVEPRRITVGLNNKITAEVTSGLSDGDLVVTSAPPAGAAGTARQGTGNRAAGGLLTGMPGGPPPGGGGGGPPPQ
ncbi:MAG TPA: efflux RND transporter periplasmic adaptor subunit [Devosia sp.]|nr:efflux RND transporter periplasmic adaptor subunit [Devosia sp.]